MNIEQIKRSLLIFIVFFSIGFFMYSPQKKSILSEDINLSSHMVKSLELARGGEQQFMIQMASYYYYKESRTKEDLARAYAWHCTSLACCVDSGIASVILSIIKNLEQKLILLDMSDYELELRKTDDKYVSHYDLAKMLKNEYIYNFSGIEFSLNPGK